MAQVTVAVASSALRARAVGPLLLPLAGARRERLRGQRRGVRDEAALARHGAPRLARPAGAARDRPRLPHRPARRRRARRGRGALAGAGRRRRRRRLRRARAVPRARARRARARRRRTSAASSIPSARARSAASSTATAGCSAVDGLVVADASVMPTIPRVEHEPVDARARRADRRADLARAQAEHEPLDGVAPTTLVERGVAEHLAVGERRDALERGERDHADALGVAGRRPRRRAWPSAISASGASKARSAASRRLSVGARAVLAGEHQLEQRGVLGGEADVGAREGEQAGVEAVAGGRERVAQRRRRGARSRPRRARRAAPACRRSGGAARRG